MSTRMFAAIGSRVTAQGGVGAGFSLLADVPAELADRPRREELEEDIVTSDTSQEQERQREGVFCY